MKQNFFDVNSTSLLMFNLMIINVQKMCLRKAKSIKYNNHKRKAKKTWQMRKISGNNFNRPS